MSDTKITSMTKLLLLASSFILIAIGCTKENVGEKNSNGVFVRVKNSSGQSFDNGQVGTTEYGLIAANSTTDYKEITTPVYAIGCLLTDNEQSFYAGMLVCGTPMPAPVAAGYYTLELKPLTTDGYYPTEVTVQ